MCTDEQHREKMAAIERINKHLETLVKGRPPVGQTYAISNTQGFILDYKGRRHVYIYTTTGITLDLKELGTLAISANTWTLIDFQEGLKLFTTSTTNPVNVFVRATDEVIA